jgi:hypothetical protein
LASGRGRAASWLLGGTARRGDDGAACWLLGGTAWRGDDGAASGLRRQEGQGRAGQRLCRGGGPGCRRLPGDGGGLLRPGAGRLRRGSWAGYRGGGGGGGGPGPALPLGPPSAARASGARPAKGCGSGRHVWTFRRVWKRVDICEGLCVANCIEALSSPGSALASPR